MHDLLVGYDDVRREEKQGEEVTVALAFLLGATLRLGGATGVGGAPLLRKGFLFARGELVSVADEVVDDVAEGVACDCSKGAS